MPNQSPTPVEQMARDISQAQSNLGSLQTKARLSSLLDQVEDLQSDIAGLPTVLADLRQRGYVYEKKLETTAQTMADRWRTLAPGIRTQIQIQSQAMMQAMPAIETKMSSLARVSTSLGQAKPLLAQVEAEIRTMEGRANAAESTIRGMYNQFQSEVSTFKAHLDRVAEAFKELSQASFQLLATEALIMSVEATWVRDAKEDDNDPKGNLYITDQRLIFEQKQEVATKKVLFITTEKKLVQQLMFEVALALIEDVKPSKRGAFKNEDHLDLRFASGAPFQTVHFHLFGQDREEWVALIQRAKAKEFDADRVVAVDAAVEEKVKTAPTTCPNCSGAITKPVLRGQDTITCEYCGSVIRL